MGLKDIKPHQVSRNLKGYSVFFYGEPKSGKTTIATKFPRALLLAFEKGYNALPGVMAQPINSWGDFKKALTELRDPDVQSMFETVILDTTDIAYSYCEKYICSRESDQKNTYENIAEIPYGKGFSMAQDEFDTCIRKILQLNYGLVLISHSTEKTFTNEKGQEVSKIVPTLDKRARLVCERTCDIIGYSRSIDTDDGNKTILFMRGTPRFVAGSRFRFTPDFIEFSYDNLVNAIAEAIDKEAAVSNGTLVTDEKTQVVSQEETYDFEALMKEFQELVGILMQKDQGNAIKITQIVDKHLGKGKKVGDCTAEQAAIIDLIVHDIKALNK
jgi:hypothetical protein